MDKELKEHLDLIRSDIKGIDEKLDNFSERMAACETHLDIDPEITRLKIQNSQSNVKNWFYAQALLFISTLVAIFISYRRYRGE